MSISETEFVWEDASDSNSSISMSSNENNESQNDYESETPKNYKKKLHKKLFNTDSTSLNNDVTKSNSSRSSKKQKIKEEPPDDISLKRKKIKVEPESDIDSISKKERHYSENGNVSETTMINYLNKKVKEEQQFVKPEPPKVKERLISSSCNLDDSLNNDEDGANIYHEKKKKKKKKSKKYDSDNSISHDKMNDSSDDYLLTKKHKKKKRKSVSSSGEEKDISSLEDNPNNLELSCINNEIAPKKKKKITSISIDNEPRVSESKKSKNRRERLTESFSESRDNDYNCNDIVIDQKSPSKSKKRKESVVSINNETDNTIVKSKKKLNKNKNMDIIDEDNNSISSEKDETVEISAILNTDNTECDIDMDCNQTLVNQDAQSNSDVSDHFKSKSRLDESDANITLNTNKSILKKNSGRQKSNKLLDKITFEEAYEGHDSESESGESHKFDSHLKKYLKINPNLKVINKKMTQGSIITSNDEVWLLNVPNDVTIDMLNDSKITIDTKCKIKINNETYVGSLDKSCGKKLNILYENKGVMAINSIYSNGIVQLHKRLPKPRIMDDNIIIEKNSFIPLPETKCRHPIFGPKYKKAMKISSAIKDRLKESDNMILEEKPNKKSKKPYKKESEDQTLEKETEDQINLEVPNIKKKKKRKVSKDEIEPKPKKIKYDPDSVEAWESEKAIEENLFNF